MKRDSPHDNECEPLGRLHVVRALPAQAADAIRLIEEYQDAIGVVVRDSPAEIIAALGSANKAVWLAYLDGKPVGCAAFRMLDQPAHAGEVKRLYLRQEHRGQGIAEQMMKLVEGHAVEQGCRGLYLDSKDDLASAIRFYERLGYVHCARYNDNPQATIFMMKDLHPSLTIRPFKAEDAEAFRTLNEAWISKLFRMEAKDSEVLGDPMGKIVAPGGLIFVAERSGQVIGCCALLAMGNGSYELSKMAVAEQERGRGAGRRLLERVVAEMRERHARRVYLETNSDLQNAIHLYRELGFRDVAADQLEPSPYVRANVFMELLLTS